MNNQDITPFQSELMHLLKDRFINGLRSGHIENETEIIASLLQRAGLSLQSDTSFLSHWYRKIVHLEHLLPYIQKDFEDLIVHSPTHLQLISSQGNEEFSNFSIDESDYQLSLEVMAFHHKINWNSSRPFVSFAMETPGFEGLRVTLVHSSTLGDAPSKVFIRKAKKVAFSLDAFSNSSELTSLLKRLIQNKKNILIAGATGSGKTTLIKAMIAEISPSEHLLILEDAHELATQNPSHTHFLAKQAPGHHLIDYCSYAMRMRPERLILGEMRSEEAVPFLLMTNTGHRGLLTTIHAHSAIDAIDRCRLMLQIYGQGLRESSEGLVDLLCKGIDIVIYVEDKKITEVIEIRGQEAGRPIFERLFAQEFGVHQGADLGEPIGSHQKGAVDNPLVNFWQLKRNLA
jgi:Flp pilus assembly CpaF family ATPase